MNCIDHTKLDADGAPVTSGHAAYQHIWQLRDDFQGIEPVQSPTPFEVGYPYC
jgi:hypothetical protein